MQLPWALVLQKMFIAHGKTPKMSSTRVRVSFPYHGTCLHQCTLRSFLDYPGFLGDSEMRAEKNSSCWIMLHTTYRKLLNLKMFVWLTKSCSHFHFFEIGLLNFVHLPSCDTAYITWPHQTSSRSYLINMVLNR